MEQYYMQQLEQSDEEKMNMYMKLPKKQIIEMLIQCNKIISGRESFPTYVINESKKKHKK